MHTADARPKQQQNALVFVDHDSCAIRLPPTVDVDVDVEVVGLGVVFEHDLGTVGLPCWRGIPGKT